MQKMINNSRGQYRADPHLNNNELIRSPLMSTIIYHNHHIIPKYRCKEIGIHPDFEGNVIRLTRLEHAEAHWHRWLKHGRKEDLAAAQLLARGEIDGIDTTGQNAYWYGKKQSPETIEKRISQLRGRKHSPESRKNFSESQKGHTVSAETRKKIGDGNRGKKHTLEWKEAMSKRMSGKNNPFYGKSPSKETRKKISEANMGNQNARKKIRYIHEKMV